MLTRLERCVLAHLPVWAADEATLIAKEEAEGGVSERRFDLPTFTARVAEDPSAVAKDPASGELRHPNLDEMGVLLEQQVERGFAARDDFEDGKWGWRMTEAGLAELVAPVEHAEDLPSGPAMIDLHPARIKPATQGSVGA